MASEKKISDKVGFPPGSLIHIGKRKMEEPKITIIDYQDEQFQEKIAGKVEECFPFRETPTVTWINIDGIHDVKVIEKIGKHFNLHPLLLEDILNTTQRPKLEDFEDYIFTVLKMLYYKEEKDIRIEAEQVSFVLGANFLISFQEREGDVFNSVREGLREGKGSIRKKGADYLAYSLLDAIVDNYFLVLEKIGEKIEFMEEKLVKNPDPKLLRTIHELKREIIFMRRSVWPLREIIGALEKIDSPVVKESTKIYLRDVYDHTIQVIETIETFRDIISGMLDIYLSSINNKMNEIMKVLTIIGTIFIPLTFITGIYGMNFVYMPELGWKFGYFAVLLVMLIILIGMIFYFKKKKWF